MSRKERRQKCHLLQNVSHEVRVSAHCRLRSNLREDHRSPIHSLYSTNLLVIEARSHSDVIIAAEGRRAWKESDDL